MATYALTATLHGMVDFDEVWTPTQSDGWTLSDSQRATIDAIGIILNNAADHTSPVRDLWAKGEIILWSPDGRILQVMEAKA